MNRDSITQVHLTLQKRVAGGGRWGWEWGGPIVADALKAVGILDGITRYLDTIDTEIRDHADWISFHKDEPVKAAYYEGYIKALECLAAGDPAALVAAASKIRETLGWTPRCDDLEQIVTQALNWERGLMAKTNVSR